MKSAKVQLKRIDFCTSEANCTDELVHCVSVRFINIWQQLYVIASKNVWKVSLAHRRTSYIPISFHKTM